MNFFKCPKCDKEVLSISQLLLPSRAFFRFKAFQHLCGKTLRISGLRLFLVHLCTFLPSSILMFIEKKYFPQAEFLNYLIVGEYIVIFLIIAKLFSKNGYQLFTELKISQR